MEHILCLRKDKLDHFGHISGLWIAVFVFSAFTFFPWGIYRILKNPKAPKYLCREWIVCAFLSGIVAYAIFCDGDLMDKPIVNTIFYVFAFNIGVFQLGRLWEKGIAFKFTKGDMSISLEKDNLGGN
jgi:hypothetical protein